MLDSTSSCSVASSSYFKSLETASCCFTKPKKEWFVQRPHVAPQLPSNCLSHPIHAMLCALSRAQGGYYTTSSWVASTPDFPKMTQSLTTRSANEFEVGVVSYYTCSATRDLPRVTTDNYLPSTQTLFLPKSTTGFKAFKKVIPKIKGTLLSST